MRTHDEMPAGAPQPVAPTYRRIVEALQEGIWVVDERAVTTFVNEPMARMLGYAAEEMLGRHLFSFMDERGRAIAERNLERRRAGIREQHDFELLRKGGARIQTTMETAPLFDARGTYRGAVAGVIDVTERRRTDEALRASEARFRVLFEQAAVGIGVASPDGVFEQCNPAMYRMLGHEAGALTGKRVADITHPDDMAATAALLDEIRGGRRDHFHVEKRWVRADGGDVHVLVSVSAIRGPDGALQAFIGAVQDLSALEQAKADLLRAQKLESLGVLAGGIAHDYNNLLTAVLASLSLASELAAPGSRQLRMLNNAEDAARQAASLAQQLLAFARGGAPVRARVELHQMVHDTLHRTLAGTGVAHDLDLPDDLWALHAEAGQIAQVVRNLVTNAVHAQPADGRVRLRARNREVLPGRNTPLTPGRYVELVVEDAGEGIAPAHLHRVFDPYFTTRPGGFGMGLAVCHRIVTRHGGHLTVRSTPGEGTLFTLLLPAWEGRPPAPPRRRRGRAQLAGRVLVMDDEEGVRKVTADALERLGCAVVETTDGAEAVATYREALEHGARFDVVIVDLTVPGGMGGLEAVTRLRRLDPAVTAVVSSGYSNDPIMADHRAHGFAGVLAKPWRLDDLTRLMEQLLEPSGASG